MSLFAFGFGVLRAMMPMPKPGCMMNQGTTTVAMPNRIALVIAGCVLSMVVTMTIHLFCWARSFGAAADLSIGNNQDVGTCGPTADMERCRIYLSDPQS